MVATTTDLIAASYYLSGVASPEFQTVSGYQLSEGLSLLNDLLGDTDADTAIVPYERTTNFTSVIGQEKYQIDDLILVDTLTFVLNSVRYSMEDAKRNFYFGAPRVNGITSLPMLYNFERGFEGGTISLYFLPNQAYVFEIHGVFRLSEVALGQDLALTLSRFYRSYLKYALAQRICDKYGMAFPGGAATRLNYYISIIKKNSRPLDLRMQKSSTLTKRTNGGWAQINLGNGWTPNGGF